MKVAIVFFLSIILLVSSPVYSVRKDTKLILDQLQKLEEAIKILDGKLTIASQKIKVIEEKVNAITRNQADGGQDKESLMLSLQFIKEEINDLKNRISKINDRLISLPAATVPTNNSTTEESQPNTTIQSPENTYYTAYSDYIKKNYQLAIEGFKQFIQLYPQNGLADNALYWIGECYYSQKMYQEAVSTFSQLVTNYADGDKIPDAILKKGYSLIEMGKQSEGITVLKELISRFPLSEEASLAQQKIKEVTD
jgi:tol-pal system protein YbgF